MRGTILVTAGALILVGLAYAMHADRLDEEAAVAAQIRAVVSGAVLYGWHCRDAGQTLDYCTLHEIPR